jgi:hypothetical protein
MGRRRRNENHSPQKKIQYRIHQEMKKKKGYAVPDLNKTMINVIKEPSDTHIKTLKEEILEDITEKFMEKILDMVN